MLEVYREVLPDSYLLILHDTAARQAEADLARALHRASRSGKPAVWLDCSMVNYLSGEAQQLLLTYDDLLPRLGALLVMCHLNDELRHQLEEISAGSLTVVNTLLDAERLSAYSMAA